MKAMKTLLRHNRRIDKGIVGNTLFEREVRANA